MKCMIVEDELPAVKIIQSHISHFNDLEVEGVYHNAMDALVALRTTAIDILFLDIQLPKISGIQLLNSLSSKPAVVMTTAHREFALDGYELEITDYLLKPISFERFTRAIAKVYKSAHKPLVIPSRTVDEPLLSEPFIYIKAEREYVKILLADLLYIESIKNHVKLVTTQSSHITLQGISEIEQKLPQGFLRIHRSFIISVQHISRFTHANVTIQSKTIPVGKYYKMSFLNWVSKNMV
jgi:DNA-binding LytR/AlgR family response regulator